MICAARRMDETRSVYIETPKQSFDDLPERSVLCRTKNCIALVVRYEEINGVGYVYEDSTARWLASDVTPLSNQEIKALLAPEEIAGNWEDSVSPENPVECWVSDISEDNATNGLEKDTRMICRIASGGYLHENTAEIRWRYAVPVNPELRNK